jgi:hypothetical protein
MWFVKKLGLDKCRITAADEIFSPMGQCSIRD